MPKKATSLFDLKGSSGKAVPTNWPSHLVFLRSAKYHSSVSPETRKYLQNCSSASNRSNYPSSNPKVLIKRITGASHPAYGQFGLFAAQRIPPKTYIIQYLGEIHCNDRPSSDYDLSLCRLPGGVSVGIDASAMGNEARFINDYRGASAKPNVVFLDGREASGELHMSIWSANHEIKKGEEILVSYGKSWWRSRAGTHDEETYDDKQ
ncbi:unnamed protein product [Cyclocybe aegerita]|uniref:SET domain-containing protein n=1 Tax=Cyclocybe aegerita TaxID=1973307 RepID=A0A8S0WJL2_CYCAE|nr:unnamed protein product [Cyclocybe aegerita]